MKRDALLSAGVVLLAAAVVLVLTWLVRFGVEPYDEPMMWAGVQRLLLGDRLFVDDWSLAQTVYLPLTPLFVAIRWINGGKEGLLLTARYVYLLLTLGIAAWLFVSLRRIASWRTALLLAVLPLVAFPEGTVSYPGFSYNSLAAWLSLILLILEIRDATAGGPSPARDAAAVAVALLCALAHPGTALGVAAYLFWRWRRSPRPAMTGSLVAGGGLLVLAGLIIPSGGDWSGLLQPSGASSPIGLKSYDGVVALRLAAVAGAALLAGRWGRHWTHIVFLAAVAFLLLRHPFTHPAAMLPLAVWSVAGTALALAGERARELPPRRLLEPVWVFGGPAALGVMVGSSEGVSSALNALAPAILVSSWMSLAVAERGRALSAALHVTLVVFLVGERLRPYHDVPVWEPTRPVASGVARGIRTNPFNAGYLEQVHEAMSRYESVPGRVLVLQLPAVFHLESTHRPVAPHVYHCGLQEPRCRMAYEKKESETCLLVRRTGLPEKSGFEERLERDYETIFEGDRFAIALRQDPGCRGNSTKLR